MYIVKIIRETSPYNKYIKWFTRGESEETGARFSRGYRTEREARNSVDKEGYKVIEINKGPNRKIYKNNSYK